MKADIKGFDFKFGVTLFLLVAWGTLLFTPAQSSAVLFKEAAPGYIKGTFLSAQDNNQEDSFEPFAVFKAVLSRISFKKAAPANDLSSVSGKSFYTAFCYTGLSALESVPALDFFFLSPPNKASP